MPISSELFLPALVLMLITFLVWINMFIRRIVATKAANIDPQDLVTPESLRVAFDDKTQAPGYCLQNLFELPVIFYALVAFITMIGVVDSFYLSLAWAFVGLRAVQASVHCTYNRVMHRFFAYLAASLVLWTMLIRFFLTFI
jgi:hypothetical protein